MKGTFTGVFGKAFSLAFTPETINAAFRVNGIHAYDHPTADETK